MDSRQNLGYPILNQNNNPNFQNPYAQQIQPGNVQNPSGNHNLPNYSGSPSGQNSYQDTTQYIPPNQGFQSNTGNPQDYPSYQSHNPYAGGNQNIPFPQQGGNAVALNSELNLAEQKVKEAGSNFQCICTVLCLLNILGTIGNIVMSGTADFFQLIGLVIIILITKPGFQDPNTINVESLKSCITCGKALMLLSVLGCVLTFAVLQQSGNTGVNNQAVAIYAGSTCITFFLFMGYINCGDSLVKALTQKAEITKVLEAIPNNV